MTNQTTDNACRPVSVVAIGAGNRMRTYMHYVETHPEEVRLVAIADPDKVRRDFIADRFNLPQEMRFDGYSDLFKAGVKADAAIIGTPEALHLEPCMLSLDAGYHILLEKPIAQSYEDCLKIAGKAKERGLKVSVCHVLRYHPLFRKIKDLIDSGRYGKIISISHVEEVGIDRDTHSYVRGTMNREKENNPMLLAKCCHDLDFLLWISGARCRKVSSFGSLRWFRKENAPEGSELRCVDCDVEHSCPFSAIDLYKRRRDWISNFIPAPGETKDEVIDRELREGRFGRCVYHCDNDVVDNQVVSMLMDNGMLITLGLNVFTQRDCRNIEIKLTEGEISCYGDTIEARLFRTRETSSFDFSQYLKIPFHGGADMELMRNFINSINGNDEELVTDIDGALETHRVIFEAERSRNSGLTVTL